MYRDKLHRVQRLTLPLRY